MPDWTGILQEIKDIANPLDTVRKKYLAQLHQLTDRNVVAYYSGWLQKPNQQGVEVNDVDMNGFMTVFHGLDKTKGLDLILHTPGGSVAATEALVKYIRSMFGTDVRAFVPQLAMSAGTMIACSCREIYMGRQSSLGPIDPQFNGIPAHGVLEEFKRALDEMKQDPEAARIWQPILAKYPPAFIGQCENAIALSKDVVGQWLKTGMFASCTPEDQECLANTIVNDLSDNQLTKTHGRHLSHEYCADLGLIIKQLEDNQDLQEAVLSVHHAYMHSFAGSNAIKIVENHTGKATILHAN